MDWSMEIWMVKKSQTKISKNRVVLFLDHKVKSIVEWEQKLLTKQMRKPALELWQVLSNFLHYLTNIAQGTISNTVLMCIKCVVQHEPLPMQSNLAFWWQFHSVDLRILWNWKTEFKIGRSSIWAHKEPSKLHHRFDQQRQQERHNEFIDQWLLGCHGTFEVTRWQPRLCGGRVMVFWAHFGPEEAAMEFCPSVAVEGFVNTALTRTGGAGEETGLAAKKTVEDCIGGPGAGARWSIRSEPWRYFAYSQSISWMGFFYRTQRRNFFVVEI